MFAAVRADRVWLLFLPRTSCRRVSVRLSVCLSVRLSQAGIVSKRQHIESRKQRRTVAQGI